MYASRKCSSSSFLLLTDDVGEGKEKRRDSAWMRLELVSSQKQIEDHLSRRKKKKEKMNRQYRVGASSSNRR